MIFVIAFKFWKVTSFCCPQQVFLPPIAPDRGLNCNTRRRRECHWFGACKVKRAESCSLPFAGRLYKTKNKISNACRISVCAPAIPLDILFFSEGRRGTDYTHHMLT
jgi:hypothetical protein